MTGTVSSGAGPVAEFCAGLKQLRQASGCEPMKLARQLKISRTQLYAILNGEVKRPPDWTRLVGPLVEACTGGDARAVAEWRRRHSVMVGVWEELNRQRRARSVDGDSSSTAPGQVVVGDIPREPPGFVARELLEVVAEVAGQGQVAIVCAVTGLRGVGKTQLAAAYARQRVANGLGLVGWVNAETHDTLLVGLARIADRLGVADPQGDSRESARRLREHLETRAADGLLVFDNAVDPASLRPFLPATGATHVVVTSTDQAFAEFGEAVDVSVFTRPESLRYLRARTGLPDQSGAIAVADALGDLPLGLAQAAATIRRQHLTYTDYLERLHRVPVGALLGAVPGGDYPEATARALLLSIQVAESNDPTGLVGQLLRVIASLSPQGVARDLLDGLGAAGRPSADEVDSAIERCVSGSLLAWSVTGDALIMHRLLGRVLRERDQTDGQKSATVATALNLLKIKFFPLDQAWSRRQEGAQLAAHAEALWEASGGPAQKTMDLTLEQLQARSWGVRQLRAAADLSRALEAGARALADCEDVVGAQHPQSLTARQDLADVCREAGRLDQAITLYEQALADREEILGVRHLDTIGSRFGLAVAYDQAGRLDQAITLYERALADRERILGGIHPDTLRSRGRLARAYSWTGRIGVAIPLHEQTVADWERVLGADHPETLLSRTSLAYGYLLAGRSEQAIPLLEATVAGGQRILGANHPETLHAQDNLAVAYTSLGRLAEAIPLHERTLAAMEASLGADQVRTLRSRDHLAVAYMSAGRIEQAIQLHEQTLAARERLLGDDHPDTLTSRHRVAEAYMSAGQTAEATKLFEKALAGRERILGADHPRTLATRQCLAESYASLGRIGEAIQLHEQTLASRERVLGTDHPDTVISRDDLMRARNNNREP